MILNFKIPWIFYILKFSIIKSKFYKLKSKNYKLKSEFFKLKSKFYKLKSKKIGFYIIDEPYLEF